MENNQIENTAREKKTPSQKSKNTSPSVFFLKFLYNNAGIIVMFVVTIVALLARTAVITHPTQDLVGFIFKWMDQITETGRSNFYQINADYSPLYLFIVTMLSFIPKGDILSVAGYNFGENWMIAVKTMYFVFEILNAFAVYFIIEHISGSKNKATIGYIVMLALPVQFINSAVWGQADCVYVCFLLYSLYFALREKGKLSFLLFGFALSFKLQAIFLAPFLVYMLLRRKVKFSDVLFAPLAVIASFLPAYFCGAGFTEPFAFYGRQLGGYSKLTSGCANFWQLFNFHSRKVDIITEGAVYMALLFIGVFFAIVWLRFIKNTGENLLNIAAFLAAVTVFFMPHMHERYFYLVDVLVVVYAIVKGKRYCLIPLMQISSGIAYHNYIGGRYFIIPWGEDSVHIAAFINIAVIGILFYDILHAERKTIKEVIAEIETQ